MASRTIQTEDPLKSKIDTSKSSQSNAGSNGNDRGRWSTKPSRGWRLRHRRPDPEAQLKLPDVSASSVSPFSTHQNGQPDMSLVGVNFNQQYPEFQEDFESELESRKQSDNWSDAKFQYLKDKYLGQRYPTGDLTDPTYGSHGHIAYFKAATHQIVETKVPIKGMTLNTASFMEAEAEWVRRQNEEGNDVSSPPDVRWIHLPANNMMWVQQTMLNILEFYHKSEPGETVSGTRAREVRDNILQRDYWQNRSVHSLEGRIWGRYMKPFSRCIRPLYNEGDVSPTFSAPTLVLYMPYLHWERNGAAAYTRHIAQDVYENYSISYRFEPDTATAPIAKLASLGASPDEQLMRRYIRYKQPLHLRHTLDQFFHPYLRDFSQRDFDQVTERYAKVNSLENFEEFKDESPLLMVDQLWIWVLGGNTILTCFPTTWGMDSGISDPLDVRSKIMYNLKKTINHSCYDSAPTIANLIINQCAANMLEPSMLVHERHKFLNFYDQSITMLMEKQTRSLKILLCMSTPDRLDAHEKLLDTTEEFSMLTEGRDIEEELKIIRIVLDRQEDALRQLQRGLSKYQMATPAPEVYSVSRIIQGLQTRQRSVDKLSNAVRTVNEQILQLLSLKQQQASISEARSSRILAEQGDQQSASMMLFTVVTILFLPLSTLTSFFGVNSAEMGSGSIPLGTVSAYIFPISALCVAISFFLGFNHQARHTILMWLDLTAEYLTGPDRNHFWAAQERIVTARLKKKRKEKRATLVRIRRRRAQARADAQNANSSSESGPDKFDLRNAYRSQTSLNSSVISDEVMEDNLIDAREPKGRTGSYSTSHIYNSGPDTEEEISDRPLTPGSRLSPTRSSRPSVPGSVRPYFHSGLVHHPDNESALFDDHHESVPPITVQGPDVLRSTTTTSSQAGGNDPSMLYGRAVSPGSRASRLREQIVIRAANQASQSQRPSPSPRTSLPEALQLQTTHEPDHEAGYDAETEGGMLTRVRTKSI